MTMTIIWSILNEQTIIIMYLRIIWVAISRLGENYQQTIYYLLFI